MSSKTAKKQSERLQDIAENHARRFHKRYGPVAKDNSAMERLARSQNLEVWEFQMWAHIDVIFGFGYALRPQDRAQHFKDLEHSANALGRIIAEQIVSMNGYNALERALTGWKQRRAGKRTLKPGREPSKKTLRVEAALDIYLAYWRNDNFSNLKRHQERPTQTELLDFINQIARKKGLPEMTKQDVSDAIKKLGREDEVDNGQLGISKAKRRKSEKVT